MTSPAFFAAVRLLILPLQGPGGDAAAECTALLHQAASAIPGLQVIPAPEVEAAFKGEPGKIFRRCGDETDCQAKIGLALKAKLLLAGSASAMDQGALLDLTLMDVGSGVVTHRFSRTVMGSPARRAAALEATLISVLFPERYVGSIELALDPPGGEVWIDGALKLESAPAQATLRDVREGQHTVRVNRLGYREFIAVVQVPYADTTRLDVKLRPGAPDSPASIPPGPTLAASDSVYKRWWFWTIVGAVVLGGVITTVVVSTK